LYLEKSSLPIILPCVLIVVCCFVVLIGATYMKDKEIMEPLHESKSEEGDQETGHHHTNTAQGERASVS
jgi:hypothetical protein